MNFRVVSPDISGALEGAINSNLLTYFPQNPAAPVDFVLVLFSRSNPDFKFNPDLYLIKEPVILVDFFEYGAHSWDRHYTHLWGTGTVRDFETFYECGINIVEWEKADKWVADCPPVLTFKRELLAKDVSAKLKPIDYTCYLPSELVGDEEAFNSRQLEVFFNWGYSHNGRKRVHGQIFQSSFALGYDIVSEFFHLTDFFKHREVKRPVWASIHTPFFSRASMEMVMSTNGKSKLSLSMPGNGVKCFRHAEAPVNSVMVKQQDTLAWSFPWVHGHNCIEVPKNQTDVSNLWGIGADTGKEEVEAMVDALERNDLYQIYLNGLENIDRYRSRRYVNEYLMPIIGKL